MRGVYPDSWGCRVGAGGSSPHARGLPHFAAQGLDEVGIIPACAGFTIYITPQHRSITDHPRMRGVYRPPSGRQVPHPGSSPHARGLRVRASVCVAASGIIPACAGFTTSLSGTSRSSRGSSPHARGLRVIPVCIALPSRIIPACAGFTPTASSTTMRSRDHPRMRGVYLAVFVTSWARDGSSPHARGLRRM